MGAGVVALPSDVGSSRPHVCGCMFGRQSTWHGRAEGAARIIAHARSRSSCVYGWVLSLRKNEGRTCFGGGVASDAPAVPLGPEEAGVVSPPPPPPPPPRTCFAPRWYGR